MNRDEAYHWCARNGMSQVEAARHIGVSQAAVSKAAKRLGLSFSAITLRRQLEMRWNRYPWEAMAVGDYFEAMSDATALAAWANRSHAPKRFKSITRDFQNIVVRAA